MYQETHIWTNSYLYKQKVFYIGKKQIHFKEDMCFVFPSYWQTQHKLCCDYNIIPDKFSCGVWPKNLNQRMWPLRST